MAPFWQLPGSGFYTASFLMPRIARRIPERNLGLRSTIIFIETFLSAESGARIPNSRSRAPRR